jgi:hypothetical protein
MLVSEPLVLFGKPPPSLPGGEGGNGLDWGRQGWVCEGTGVWELSRRVGCQKWPEMGLSAARVSVVVREPRCLGVIAEGFSDGHEGAPQSAGLQWSFGGVVRTKHPDSDSDSEMVSAGWKS